MIKYWRMVFVEAARMAWGQSGMRKATFAVLSALFASFLLLLLTGSGTLPETIEVLIGDFNSELRVNLIYLGGTILFILIIFVFALIYTPARIHDRQKSRENELKEEINRLRDMAKPELELRFDADHKSSIQNVQQFPSIIPFIYRVFVINKSSMESVEKISVKLVDVVPNHSLTFLPAELRFLNNQEKRLSCGDSLLVDVISIQIDKNLLDQNKIGQFCFENRILKRRQLDLTHVDDFMIVLEATGENTSPVRKTFKFSSNLRGEQYPYELEEYNGE